MTQLLICYRASDPHDQVSITSLNAKITLPMDRLSTKLFNPPERAATSLGVATPRAGGFSQYSNTGGCFGGRSRLSRNHYTIHPDWVSESFNVQKVTMTDRSQDFIDKVKRSQSCPPPMRNVLTWDERINGSK